MPGQKGNFDQCFHKSLAGYKKAAQAIEDLHLLFQSGSTLETANICFPRIPTILCQTIKNKKLTVNQNW